MSRSNRWTTFAVVAAISLGLGSGEAAAQGEQTPYTHSRCYKAHPGKLLEMRQFFDATARTMGEEGVKAGKYVAYNVLEAENAARTGQRVRLHRQ